MRVFIFLDILGKKYSNFRACLNCTKKDQIFYEVASCRLFVIDDSHYSFGSLLRHEGESEERGNELAVEGKEVEGLDCR